MMTITNAAAEVIRRCWQRSADLSYPVIYLVQVSKTPRDVTDAIERGASRKELQEISQKAMKSVPKYLFPAIYPGSRFIWLTTTINGFRFASRLFYAPPIRHAMGNGILDVAERGLVLKDADGTVVLPANDACAL